MLNDRSKNLHQIRKEENAAKQFQVNLMIRASLWAMSQIIVTLAITGCQTACAKLATSANYNSICFVDAIIADFVAKFFAILVHPTSLMGNLFSLQEWSELVNYVMTK
jgi:hypothetical protein